MFSRTYSVVVEVSGQPQLLRLWVVVQLPLSELLTAEAIVLRLPLQVDDTHIAPHSTRGDSVVRMLTLEFAIVKMLDKC